MRYESNATRADSGGWPKMHTGWLLASLLSFAACGLDGEFTMAPKGSESSTSANAEVPLPSAPSEEANDPSVSGPEDAGAIVPWDLEDAGEAPLDGAPDALPGLGTDSGSKDSGSKDSPDAAACLGPLTAPSDGHHNPGADCLACHQLLLNPARRFTVAGTLFANASSSTPVAGAVVELVQANGRALRLVTHQNGNFYTTEQVTFPLRVRATRCPSQVAMVGAVSNGSCNRGGCHDANLRMHLP